MTLELALATVKAAGYRVTKPRAKKTFKRLVDNGDGTYTRALNAVGKPYGENYDPNYKMRYRTPPLKRAQNVSSYITPEQWTLMCKLAKAEWDKTHKATDDGIPEFLRRDTENKVAA
jgi:hypothetical protein